MKDLKCLRCGQIYEPILRVRDSKIFCVNCSPFQIIKDLDLIEGIASIEERKDKLKLLEAISNIKNIDNFFFALLLYQDKISAEYFNLGSYPLEYVRKWVYSQYLLDLIFSEKLSSSYLKNLQLEKIFDEYLVSKLESLIPLAEKAYSYDRYFEEYKNGKVIHANNGSGIELYITNEKILFATPKDIYEFIIEKNPFHYNGLLLDCKGYSPNILINMDSRMQEWSLSAKIFTNIAKFTSVLPFNIDHLKNPEISVQILRTHAVEYAIIDYSPFYPLIMVFNKDQNKFLNDLKRLTSFGFAMKGTSFSDDRFEDYFIETFNYFSIPFTFRRIFYRFKDCYIVTLNNLNLFSSLMESQNQILRKNKKREIRAYRGIENLERNIWNFGFHLNVDLILNLKPRQRNLKVKSPEGEYEVDVVFYRDNKVEFIECKSDIAINLLWQEDYFRKMRKKINPVKNSLELRGYIVKNIIPSMICQICIVPPPDDIDIYLSELHLFEALTRRNGLFKWDGKNFFDNYPIIARIGWENCIISEELNIDLNHLLPDSNLSLKQTTIDEVSINFSLELDKDIEWEYLDIIAIYNKSKSKIVDFLFLPPYYKQQYNDHYTWSQSSAFHFSIYGQRFLHIASKNGIFGFCPDCLTYPLVPTGYAYKPARFSAKGICPNCSKSIELNALDSASFHKNENLIRKVKISFDSRLQKSF